VTAGNGAGDFSHRPGNSLHRSAAHHRHPEVRAVFGEPRRMVVGAILAAILRGSQELAPQDDAERHRNAAPRSRDGIRPRFAIIARPKQRGRGEDRVRAAPAVSCAIVLQQKPHTSIQVKREHPGLPCAVALRIIACSPRRTGFLASVARKKR
jgi:hypothetical protein